MTSLHRATGCLRRIGVLRPAARLGLVLTLVACCAVQGASPREQAIRILDETGVTGGLIVHVGCGDGKLTAALLADDRYLIHGLDADAGDVERAREYIRSRELYGKVSVQTWSRNRLPYIDNVVNLVVSEDIGDVPMAEIMRVLVPEGVAFIKQGGTWTSTLKPRPGQIDEWTHYLHDASNNAVAHDTAIGPPRHLQWDAGPTYSRHHGFVTGPKDSC